MTELFVGVTSWNDEMFLPTCLESIRRCLKGLKYTICVLDNNSSDRSQEIIRKYNSKLIVKKCIQADALNILLNQSEANYTLLMHSDVALLTENIFELLVESIDNNVLVSPEDIGLGNYDRKKMGAGMPESSFMFWRTNEARALRSLGVHYDLSAKKIIRNPFILFPKKRFDFYGPHITHDIPELLQKNGYRWKMMDVFPSSMREVPWFVNDNPEAKWITNDWGYREYGFGNFYSTIGQITHYHNWFSRDLNDNSILQKVNNCRVPMAYIQEYTSRFTSDYTNNQVKLPDIISRNYEGE